MVIEDIFPGEGGISFLLVGCDSLYVLSLSAVIYSPVSYTHLTLPTT